MNILLSTNRKLILSFLICASAVNYSTAQNIQATDETFKGKIGKTAKESQEWWPEKTRAPKDAPNIIWVLIDDCGFGTSSAFGGLAETPVFDSLANNGLRYTNFHTTAICSPTRAALLTGRNHHSVHMGYFPVTATGFPGYDARMPFDKATVAEILHQYNYNTYSVGKWHVTPTEEVSPAGPFDRWPTGRGFDHFYGWHLGHTDQYHPNLYEDLNVIDIEPNKKHVSTLLADKAIKYIANQKSAAPDKPFFLYFATGAIHAPHQVDKSFIDKYKGKFDGGWDEYREKVFERQKKLGVIPANAVLPPRNPDVAAWNSLTGDEKKVNARFMEVYAAFLTQADYEVGRIIDYLKEIGQLDNTAIFVMIGDNGASKGGTKEGTITRHISSLPHDEQIQELLKNYDKMGTEFLDPDVPIGWSQACDVPFRYWKADANSEGGTHNPLIVFYPKGIKEKGGIRTQYSHVIDILPTTLDLIGVEPPGIIKGYKQKPIEGYSLFNSFNNKDEKSLHTVQYYEIAGKRAIYKDGWKAEVYHKPGTDFSTDKWELYNLNEDYTELNDLALKEPAKLKEMQDAFDSEAIKYNVYPLNDKPPYAGRRHSIYDTASKIVLYPGVDQLLCFSGPQFQTTSFTITADADITSVKNEGVLFSTGSEFDGLSLFIKDGKFQVAHNTGDNVKYLESAETISTGKHLFTFELNYTGNTNDKQIIVQNATQSAALKDADAGTESIYINNKKVDERKITQSEIKYIGFYLDGIDVGQDLNSPVSPKYSTPFKFTGKLNKVTIEYK